MNKRLEAVVSDIVEGVLGALTKHDVTFDGYRQGLAYIIKTVDQPELPLLIDVFLNTTICQIENRNPGGSMSTLEGPYFLDDAPFVNGALKTYHDDRHEPLLMRGKVIDEFGAPIAGAVIDLWHSTPDGHYGGSTTTSRATSIAESCAPMTLDAIKCVPRCPSPTGSRTRDPSARCLWRWTGTAGGRRTSISKCGLMDFIHSTWSHRSSTSAFKRRDDVVTHWGLLLSWLAPWQAGLRHHYLHGQSV